LLPDVDESDEETIIDVSGDQPRVLDEEQLSGPFGGRIQGGFTTVRVEQGRVVVSQGNRLTCLLVLVATILFVCCSCWFFWWIPARLF
jgi:hypothetical protein